MDGSTPIGTAIATDGVASMTTTLSPGAHTLTARYPGVYSFPSPAVTYVVNAPTPVPAAEATTTMLTVFPNRTFEGLPAVLLANVAPFGVTGAVQFMDGTTALGAPVPVTAGFALHITPLPKGTRSLTAAFTPTGPTAFGPSTSPSVSLTVNPLFRVR